jgi:hypothetical protein
MIRTYFRKAIRAVDHVNQLLNENTVLLLLRKNGNELKIIVDHVDCNDLPIVLQESLSQDSVTNVFVLADEYQTDNVVATAVVSPGTAEPFPNTVPHPTIESVPVETVSVSIIESNAVDNAMAPSASDNAVVGSCEQGAKENIGLNLPRPVPAYGNWQPAIVSTPKSCAASMHVDSDNSLSPSISRASSYSPDSFTPMSLATLNITPPQLIPDNVPSPTYFSSSSSSDNVSCSSSSSSKLVPSTLNITPPHLIPDNVPSPIFSSSSSSKLPSTSCKSNYDKVSSCKTTPVDNDSNSTNSYAVTLPYLPETTSSCSNSSTNSGSSSITLPKSSNHPIDSPKSPSVVILSPASNVSDGTPSVTIVWPENTNPSIHPTNLSPHDSSDDSSVPIPTPSPQLENDNWVFNPFSPMRSPSIECRNDTSSDDEQSPKTYPIPSDSELPPLPPSPSIGEEYERNDEDDDDQQRSSSTSSPVEHESPDEDGEKEKTSDDRSSSMSTDSSSSSLQKRLTKLENDIDQIKSMMETLVKKM